jgi:molecular chaperone DnaK
LRVSARDLGTGRNQSVMVMPTSGLSQAELDRLLSESMEMAELDQVRRRIADARVKGEGLIHSSERAVAEFGEILDEHERELLLSELADCRAGLESEDLMTVEEAVARLEVSAQQLGEAIYAASAGGRPE